MRRTHSPKPRPRSEHQEFATTMRTVRVGLKLPQSTMASQLGVSQRILSDWENGYALPDRKAQLHFVYKMHALAPDRVETLALLLGLGEHPALQPLFPQEPAPPPRPVEVVVPLSPPPPTREEIRAQLDAVVREAADAVDVRASDLRRGLCAVLDALVETGTSIEDARAALGLKVKDRARTERGT